MENYLKKYGQHALLTSILLIILSFFLIYKPIQSVNIIMILLGCIVVINGLIHAISYFSCPTELRAFNFELVQGILGIVVGFIFVLRPEWLLAILPIAIGIWIIVESIIRFQLALNMRTIENKKWILMVIFSIVTAVFGLFIIIYPIISAAVLTSLCGYVLLISEVINIIECVYIMMKLK